MIRQYHAQRFLAGTSPRAIGTIPVGSILYIQDRPSRHTSPSFRNPWIVEAFVPREVGAAKKVDGHYVSTFMAGGHLAVVRSLRTNERRLASDTYLLHASDEGHEVHSAPARGSFKQFAQIENQMRSTEYRNAA